MINAGFKTCYWLLSVATFFFYSRWLLLFVAILSATVIFEMDISSIWNVYIVTEVCIRLRAHVHVSAWLVFFIQKSIHSLFFAHLKCISFIYPERSWNSIFAQCHEQCWTTDKTILFYLCIHVGFFFFFAFVVLTEHCSGCPHIGQITESK